MAAKETIKMMVLMVCLFLSAGLALAQSPGDTLGWTRQDYQTNGSTGTRCALDNHNGTHVIWFWGGQLGYRCVYYNYIDSSGHRIYGNSGMALCEICGMPQMAVNDTDALGIVFISAFSLDSAVWLIYPDVWRYPPNLFWPYNSISAENHFHMVGVYLSFPPLSRQFLS